MASLSPYAITLGSTDYPVKYAGLLSYVEPYLTNLESFTFSAGNVSLAGNFTLGAASDLTLNKGTANGVLYLNGSKVATSGTDLVFNATGLGIGTSSPAAKLDVQGSSGDQIRVRTAGTEFYRFGRNSSTGFLDFYGSQTGYQGYTFGGVDGTWATINASGNLGIGTTSPTSGFRLDVQAATARQRIESTTGTNEVHQRYVNTGGTFYAGLDNSTGGGFGAAYGAVLWHTGNYPMVFATNDTERARITSGGDLLVGTTSATGKLSVQSSGNTYTVYSENTNTSSTSNYLFWGYGNAATRFIVYGNGGIANYSANDVNLSDRREKTNFAPAKSYLDTICAIPVQTFEYIDQSPDDPGLTLGVVAQDVRAVAPELVMESNWGTEDNPKMRLSIYQTDLQYALMKCVQELKAELDATKARLVALEAQP